MDSNDDGDKHTTTGGGVEATHKSTTLAVSEELYNAKFRPTASHVHDNDTNNHATNMTTAASATPKRRCRRTVQDPRRKPCRPHNTSTTTRVGENHDQAEAVSSNDQRHSTSIASSSSEPPQAPTAGAGGLSPSDEAAATASDSISSLSASSVSLFLEEEFIQTASAKSQLDVTPTHSTVLLAEPGSSSSSSPSLMCPTTMNQSKASVKTTHRSLDAANGTCSSQQRTTQQKRRTEGRGATAAARPYRDSIMVKTTASFEANCRAAAAMKTPTHSTSKTTKKAVCLLKEKRGSAAKTASTAGGGGVVTPSRLTRRTSAKSPILHGKNKNISPTVESPRSVTSNLLFSCPTTTSPGPPSPLISKHTTNTIVWLIRHGESIGQLASTIRRRTDPALLDCGLTDRGRQQALEMTTRYNLPPAMDMVLCSPLTRALQTAVLAFGTTTNVIRIHYELREFGCGKANVPENQPRPWNQVLADVLPNDEAHGFDERRIDIPSPPPNWPLHHDKTPNVLRRNYIQQIFQGLAAATADGHDNEVQQEQKHIAVVCHFHVIRAALTDPKGFCDPQLKPENATPLPCYLTKEGRLIRC